MSYLALYRKFRPYTFDEVVGQEHIIKTLKSQIQNDKIGHAYLFCGSRGTGKTSLAKMFARAVNCENPIEGEACGKCNACLALKSVNNLDVVEIDAASNNKVDEIRELREQVNFMPSVGRFRVFIIDEVHMLTDSAFNALLKTLEEPPRHIIFILATTEPHKLPQTILSRCMRFDFKLLSVVELKKHIEKIFKILGKEYDETATLALAKSGEGSVRDMLSVAELCISNSDKVTYNNVLDILGSTDKSILFKLANEIVEGKMNLVLETVDEIAMLGKSMSNLCLEMIEFFRTLLIVKTCKNPNNILYLPEDVLKDYTKLCKKIDEMRILKIYENFEKNQTEFRYSSNPRTTFEICACKCAKPETDYNLDSLFVRVKTLEDKLAQNKTEVVMSHAVPLRTDKEEIRNNSKQIISNNQEFEIESKPNSSDVSSLAREMAMTEIQREKETKTQEQIKSEISKLKDESDNKVQNVSADKVWPNMILIFRQRQYILLYALARELEYSLNGKTLTLILSSERESMLIKKPENLSIISGILAEFGDYELKLVDSKEEVRDINDDISLIKKQFGEDIVKINK